MKIKGLLLLGCLFWVVNVWAQAPTIISFGNATPGYEGDLVAQVAGCGFTTADAVSISGTNFNVAGLQVFLGTVQVAIITSNATYLEFSMPDISTLLGIKTFSNKLKVQTNGGSATSTGVLFATFCLDTPPTTITTGAQFQITGTDLASVTNISFTGGSIADAVAIFSYNPITSSISITAPTVAGTSYLAILQNNTNLATTPGFINFIAPATTCTSPVITTQPFVPLVLCSNSTNIILNASATGTALGYNWQLFNAAVWTDILSETNTSITILGINAINGASYRLRATNSCGTVFSNAATLTVSSPPIIVNEPATPGGICQQGGTVLLSADASGQSLTYRWQIQAPGSTSWSAITQSSVFQGVFTPTLSINNPLLSLNGYKFRIRVDGKCANTLTGIVSNGLTRLTVFGTFPTIISIPTAPKPVCYAAGTTALSISATGVDLSYQWEEFTTSWNAITEDYYFRNPTTETLTFYDPDTSINTRKYRVKVSGACSQSFLYSDIAGIAINVYPRPKIVPTITNECVTNNSKLSIAPDPNFKRYQWKLDSATLNSDTIANYTLLINGFYSVYVNGNPKCSSKGYNYVSLTKKPSVQAFGNPDTLLTTPDTGSYQWYVNKRLIQGAKSKSLTVHFNGTYFVEVKYANGCIGVSDNKVVQDPSYIAVLKSGAVFTDSTITFGEAKAVDKISIAPNPSSGSFMLSYTSPNKNSIKVSLIDMTGNMVREITLSQKDYTGKYYQEINTKSLTTGIYQLQIVDGQSVHWSKVIIY